MAGAQLDQVRRIALALPGVSERPTHGAVGFYVTGRPLCYVHDDHRGDGRVSMWFPSSAAVQEELVTGEPDRFFAPQPSASGTFSTWVAVFLDSSQSAVDWSEIREILLETYRRLAPRRLVAELDAGQGG